MTVVFMLLGIAATIAGVVFLYLKVIPKKYDGTFQNKLLQFVHDYFNFKELYIEKVIKAIFTFLTIAVIIFGVVVALSGITTGLGNLVEYHYYYGLGDFIGDFFVSIVGGIGLISIVCPIIIRLLYEGIMMSILLVKNTIEINNKLKEKE